MNRFFSICRMIRREGFVRPIMLSGELLAVLGEPAPWQLFNADNDNEG